MTWAEFNTAVRVHLLEYARIASIQALLDQWIKAGVTDIQRVCEYYRTGHEDSFDLNDLVADGFAYRGDVPKGRITGARVYRLNPDTSEPIDDQFNWCEQVSWDQAPMMRAGLVDQSTRFAVDPQHRTFLLTPTLNDESVFVLEWVGVKTDFEDDDETPFDDEVVHAVGEYVLARAVRKVDHDINESGSYAASYVLLKRKLVSETLEYGRLAAQPVGSSTPSTSVPTVESLAAGFQSGTAEIENVDDETIVVEFETEMSAAPGEIFITPLTGMPGWVVEGSITTTGFTIALAGEGPAGTKFFYRAYL